MIPILLFLFGILAIGAYFGWDRLREHYLLVRALNLTLVKVRMPRLFTEKEMGEKDQRTQKDTIGVMEQLLSGLAQMQDKGLTGFILGRPYIAFELACSNVGEEITFYFSAPRKWLSSLEKSIHALYPVAEITYIKDYNIFHPQGVSVGAIMKQQAHWALPVKTYRTLEIDPIEAITNSLSKLNENGEGAAFQILIRPSKPSVRKFGLKVARQMQKSGHEFNRAKREVSISPESVFVEANRILSPKSSQQAVREAELQRQGQTNPNTPWFYQGQQPITPLHQETIKAIEGKSSKLFFETNIRLIASAPTESEAEEILTHMEGAFAQFADVHLNGFRSVRKHGKTLQNLLFRFSFRIFSSQDSILLNSEEVTSIFHFPNVPLETPKVEFLKAKPAPPPTDLSREGIIIGRNIYRGQETLVRMALEDRRRHLYVIGQTGTGKTTLLQEMIRQDILAGNGVGVIEPHGDLAESILSIVPRNRAQDVIYFDPSDTERPMGLNMLEWKTPEQKDFAVQEMIRIFEKLFPPEVIGPMFEHNMRNAMLTLMADPEDPGTIAEIPRIFTDDAFAKAKVAKVHDPMVQAFWEKEMSKTTEFHKSEMLGYLISKVGRFVENEMLRNIIGQGRSGFDIKDIMDNGKIFIANLSKGKTGEVNASLLGLVLVAKMQMAALARASMPEEQRRDFFLYVDEFQNFTTDSISTILSEARKYKLNLIIAHQFVSQLSDQIREAVFGNVGSLISFRVGSKDAEFLVKQFTPVFNERDLVNIDNFSNYVKLMIHGKNALPFNTEIFKAAPGNAEALAALKEFSRMQFGKDKNAVEQEIFGRSKLAQVSGPTNFIQGESNR